MATLIKPYEISVWEDVLVTEDNISYYKEKKIAVIGSNEMTGPNRVYEPVLKQNMNGEVSLTFSLKHKYFDPISEKMIINPFESFLVNERKIKLFYDGKWYDFIIKTHEESTEEYTWTYTAVDAAILELSKTGYNIEFDVELNNNQGTIEELAEKTLKDTDWQVGECNIGRQTIEEAIYRATLVSTDLHIINTDNEQEPYDGTSDIYLFYSYVSNESGKFVQFIKQDTTHLDDKNNIIATNYRILDELVYDDGQFKLDGKTVITINSLETAHHAYRLVYKQKTTYDPVMGRTVDIFSIGEEKEAAYRYIDYDYTTSDIVVSYITNGSNFDMNSSGGLQGWEEVTASDPVYIRCDKTMTTVIARQEYYEFINGQYVLVQNPSGSPYEKGYYIKQNFSVLDLTTYPLISTDTKLIDLVDYTEVEGFLETKFGGLFHDYKNSILNTGIMDNTPVLNSISQGQKFVLRWRAGYASERHGALNAFNKFGAIVAKYTLVEENNYWLPTIDPNGIILQFEGAPNVLNNIISGGELNDDETAYIIDGVVQEPSTKYIYKVGDEDYVWAKQIYTLCDNTMTSVVLEQEYYQLVDGRYVLVQNPSGSPYDNGYYYTEAIRKYVPKISTNFIDYYYLTAEASQAIPNKVLADPTVNIGIFIYLPNVAGVDANNWYYIQDIQLTKLYEDANNEPVVIGNIPVANSIEIEHYYTKPQDGTAAEDVTTYADINSFAEGIGVSPDSIKPLYNEGSVKILSISESHSNCFNILQSIAETFEAWLDVNVIHEDDGSIKLDNNKKPFKFISFKEFAGKDNYAGFKYGINLNSIQRTLESDEIVSKLIVDQSQSDYNDDGFVSIQSATANPSGESYILNFDYYFSKKLIENPEACRSDIENFNITTKEYNNSLKAKEQEKLNLEGSLVQIESKRNVYTELVNTAKDFVNEGLFDFKKATGWDYYDYIEIYEGTVGDIYILTKDTTVDPTKTYYIKKEDNTYEIVINPVSSHLYEYYEKVADFLENDQIINVIGKIYANSSVINNYQGLLNNTEVEYKNLRKQLYGNETYTFTVTVVEGENYKVLKLYLNDYMMPFSFDVNGDTYSTSVSVKSFDIFVYGDVDNYDITNLTAGSDYTVQDNDGNIITSIPYEETTIRSFKIVPNTAAGGIADEIKVIREEKNEYTSDFFKKYNRFIQEGTWNSTDYIDSELYYLDALQVSNTSAEPKVSYSIEVVEISELEGFENYTFAVGDKTWIEDEEFFGWNSVLNAPAREEVIVSEVEWHLDEPQKNIVTVQNYRTQFEDLFQRVNATVQSVQYNEATYAKTSSFVDANGTIKEDTLLASLDKIKGRKYALTTDGSVFIEGDAVYVRNLTNPANCVIINSEGIRISEDGGVSWSTAINGRGINAGLIYTGALNTDEITIGNRKSPSFRWDKYGISAFKAYEDETYDLRTYVRFDQYGLYGIKDGDAFRTTSITDVEEKAQFGITWHGFFIKNSYPGGGRVEITSDNDFRVLNVVGGHENEKIKIGALEWGTKENPIYTPIPGEAPRLYGIRIKDNYGNEVFKTDDDGNVTITGIINALGGNFTQAVYVGRDYEDDNKNYIVIDGENSLIRSSLYNDAPSTSATLGWMIDANGDAVFNNITARGAIKTAVFEYAEIQAVGGVFLFRPSSTIKTAELSGNNIVVTVEKTKIFTNGNWCKISNYVTDGSEPDVSDIRTDGGLTHIYKITVDFVTNKITLIGAKALADELGADAMNKLEGGALVDMGKENGVSTNYGIGINSSDNSVDLPSRAISLFETTIRPNETVKVSYDYKGILGTLPPMSSSLVSNIYTNNMVNTQGIYTDNMYIGDANQYVAFYTEGNSKKLKVRAETIEFGSSEEGYTDVSDGNIDVVITSNKGNIFKDNVSVILTCTVYQYGQDITPASGFQWFRNGTPISGATSRTLSLVTNFDSTVIYSCEVEI